MIQVPTPWGKHHVLAAHAPQINIGCEPYLRWWADMWCDVTRMLDPTTVLVLTDTKSASRPTGRETPRSHDMDYGTFL